MSLGWRALQLMHRVVKRRRALHGGGAVSDDHELLRRLVSSLEAAPRPRGWPARLRHRWELRKAQGMLEWEEAREEGPACLIPQRNAIGLAWFLMWVGAVTTALLRGHHPLTLSRIGLVLGLSALPWAAGVLYLRAFPKRMWRANERQFAAYLEQARALPAAAGRPDSEAAV